MKILRNSIIVSFLFLFGLTAFAQKGNADIPAVNIQTLEGSTFNTSNISNDGAPIIINFWATWCAPCKRELNNIAEMYEDWQDETNVKIVAISIDDTRNIAKVAPYVNGKNWDYEVYLDPNGDFKRAMGVNNVPHTFLLDGNGKIVHQSNSYSEGDEYGLFELVKKVANGESIK